MFFQKGIVAVVLVTAMGLLPGNKYILKSAGAEEVTLPPLETAIFTAAEEEADGLSTETEDGQFMGLLLLGGLVGGLWYAYDGLSGDGWDSDESSGGGVTCVYNYPRDRCQNAGWTCVARASCDPATSSDGSGTWGSNDCNCTDE